MDLISLTDNVLVTIVKLSDISFELSPFEVSLKCYNNIKKSVIRQNTYLLHKKRKMLQNKATDTECSTEENNACPKIYCKFLIFGGHRD